MSDRYCQGKRRSGPRTEWTTLARKAHGENGAGRTIVDGFECQTECPGQDHGGGQGGVR